MDEFCFNKSTCFFFSISAAPKLKQSCLNVVTLYLTDVDVSSVFHVATCRHQRHPLTALLSPVIKCHSILCTSLHYNCIRSPATKPHLSVSANHLPDSGSPFPPSAPPSHPRQIYNPLPLYPLLTDLKGRNPMNGD